MIFIALLLVDLHSLVSAEEICCCPDLTVYLKCKDKNSDSDPAVKTSLLKANGYVCDALDSTDVTLECNVAEVDQDAVKSVTYSYYKAHEISLGTIVAYDSTKSKKLVSCDETEPTCTLEDVKWSGAVYTPDKFDNFDNFIYQCIVEITLEDDTKFQLPSNTMWLDIYKNVPESNPSTEEEDKTALNTNKAYEKLTCGSDSDSMPVTNPRTRAKWSFKGLDPAAEWAELNIPEKSRMGLVEPDIADESNSFLEGTLILMLFDPTEDEGHYKCEADYVTTTVGTGHTYQRAQYKITGSGQQDPGSVEIKMLSAITSATFTLKDDYVDFTCYARDTDASVSGTFKWVYMDGDNKVTVVPSDDLFKGVTILNYGRTLRLPSEYKYYDYTFKCEVTNDAGSVISDPLKQPVVVPQEMYIPITTRSCSNPDSAIELSPNKRLMMSDEVVQDAEDYVQKLSGAKFKWMLNAKAISPFDNAAAKGGITTEEKLKIPDDLFKEHYAGTYQKCRYFTFVQSRSNGYQLPEVLKLTRPSDESCADLHCPDAAPDVTADCDEGTLTVSLAGSSPQCLSVEVKDETGASLYNKPFDKVAASCSARKLAMTITKENIGQEKLQGKYTVIVSPEGKQGCSNTANCGTARCSKPIVNDYLHVASISPDIAQIEFGQSYTVTCIAGFVPEPSQLDCGAHGKLSADPHCIKKVKDETRFPVWAIVVIVIVCILIFLGILLLLLMYMGYIPCGKDSTTVVKNEIALDGNGAAAETGDKASTNKADVIELGSSK